MWSHFVQSQLLEWIQVVVLVRLFGSYRKWLLSMLSLSLLLICSALKLVILFLNKSMIKCLCVWFKIFYLMEFVLGAFNVKNTIIWYICSILHFVFLSYSLFEVLCRLNCNFSELLPSWQSHFVRLLVSLIGWFGVVHLVCTYVFGFWTLYYWGWVCLMKQDGNIEFE